MLLSKAEQSGSKSNTLKRVGRYIGGITAGAVAAVTFGGGLINSANNSPDNKQYDEYAKYDLVGKAKPGDLPKDAILEKVPSNVNTTSEFVGGLPIKPEDEQLVGMIVEKELGGTPNQTPVSEVAIPGGDYQTQK